MSNIPHGKFTVVAIRIRKKAQKLLEETFKLGDGKSVAEPMKYIKRVAEQGANDYFVKIYGNPVQRKMMEIIEGNLEHLDVILSSRIGEIYEYLDGKSEVDIILKRRYKKMIEKEFKKFSLKVTVLAIYILCIYVYEDHIDNRRGYGYRKMTIVITHDERTKNEGMRGRIWRRFPLDDSGEFSMYVRYRGDKKRDRVIVDYYRTLVYFMAGERLDREISGLAKLSGVVRVVETPQQLTHHLPVSNRKATCHPPEGNS